MIDKSKYRIKEEVNEGGRTVYYVQKNYFGLFWGPLLGDYFGFGDPYTEHISLESAQQELRYHIKIEKLKKTKPKYHYLEDE